MTTPRIHPFVTMNAGAPTITRNPSPPEYKAISEPHQVAVAGGGSDIPDFHGPDIGAALGALGVKQHQESPHMPQPKQEGEAPGGARGPAGEAPAGEAGAAEAGAEGTAALGAGAGEAAGGLEAAGLVGGLL